MQFLICGLVLEAVHLFHQRLAVRGEADAHKGAADHHALPVGGLRLIATHCEGELGQFLVDLRRFCERPVRHAFDCEVPDRARAAAEGLARVVRPLHGTAVLSESEVVNRRGGLRRNAGRTVQLISELREYLGCGVVQLLCQVTHDTALAFLAAHAGYAGYRHGTPSERDWRDAYRRAARRLHPDTGGDTRRFQRLQDAARTLGIKH